MDDVEMEESVGSEHQDRLSELPKSLILLILSFLPMRDVVSTTLLSKSWENLWTTVPCLNFKDCDGTERFQKFVNGALILWEGTHILRFQIDIECLSDMSLAGHMDLWVRFAVKHNVEELNIHLCCEEGGDLYKAPRCLNSCSSLTKLSLVGCSLQIHGSPEWNQLKCLSMCESRSSEELINQIMLGTPQLEVFYLNLRESKENLNIQSASLKELTIHKYLFSDEQPLEDTVLKICCPNLESLEFIGVTYSKCLLSNVSSLSGATLGFQDESGSELLGETLRQILPSIQHVERLRLSIWCVEVLDAYQKKYLLSPLLNVNLLELHVGGRIGLAVIINLLGIFPNLKMLVIEDSFYNPFVENISKYSDYLHNIPFVENAPDFNASNFLEFETSLSKSILGQLKTVDITSYFSHTSIYQIMEFFLKHACKLEKLVIRGRFFVSCGRDSCPQTCFSEAAKVVLNMPRSSPNAKVIFRM